MIKVYISGPIAKPNRKKGRYGKNIVPAMQAWEELWDLGYNPYCPHFSYFQDNWMQKHGTVLEHGDWMMLDLDWLKQCDCMLRLPGESPGADMEEAYAKHHGIPVYYSVEELDKAVMCHDATPIHTR